MIPAPRPSTGPASGEIRTGRDVPFMIGNVPHTDPLGRETVTFVRTFDLPGRSSDFDARTVLSSMGDRSLDVRAEACA